MEETFAQLVNFLWGECIGNLSKILGEAEQGKFTNNDYYYLYLIDSLGEPNLSTIAEALALTKPGVTSIVQKLCNMGLVMKRQSNEDKRVHFVSLTQKGKDILNGDRSVYKTVTEEISSLCKTEQEQQFINNMLKQLIINLENRKKGNENEKEKK